MSATGMTETLTVVEHMAWVVDNAYLPQRAYVDDDGVVTPVGERGPQQLAVDAMEARLRTDARGVRREITVRLFMILLLSCAWHRRIWVCDLYTFATGVLPVDVQRELGIMYWSNKNGRAKLRTINAKQLYNLVDDLRLHLDVDPDFDLNDDEVAERLTFLDDVKDAFLYATHLLELTGTSVAVDETGVWSWMRGGAKPKGLPLADPTDEDKAAAAAMHRPIEEAIANPVDDSKDPVEDVNPDDLDGDDIVDDDGCDLVDEDDPDLLPAEDTTDADPSTPASSGSIDGNDKAAKLGARCWFCGWGVKTHKTGKRSSYFGCSMHTLIRVPEVGHAGKRAAEAIRFREPLLIEEFAVTTPATDVVEPTLAMVKKRIGRGIPVVDLLGDRHYSYKKFERWASPLWRLKVRPVLDLRETDHGATYYEGAIIIDGTPHLDPPQHLRELQRPAKGASKAQRDKFVADIAERQKYAFKRHKGPWTRNDGKPGGDGKTRWVSPVSASTVGCRHDDDSVAMAKELGLPILEKSGHEPSLCMGGPLLIQPGVHMKLHQQEYWGSREWLVSWNRRTYVEAAFGVMKNYATGNIHRGFMRFTGRALITLGLTAAVVAYNLRELENWFVRASKHCPDNPLLAVYEQHPLHQPTKWVYGHKLLSRDERAQWEQDWLDEITSAGDSSDSGELPDAA